jgi:predicted nuclease of predicted toxin-antitoxin system
MRSEAAPIRLLLDEHYPGWLAEKLTADGVDTVALNAHRPELRGADDAVVLRTAVDEGRVVVTEDVSTFGLAIRQVTNHVGVIFCHHARYPRTRTGLELLHRALLALAAEPPEGLGNVPVEWWLPALTDE